MTTRSGINVEVTTRNGATVVSLDGDAGIGGADALQGSLLPITASRPALVVFDLSRTIFISSLAVGMLIEFQRGLARHGGVTRLASPQPLVKDMLVKCRIDIVLPIFDSVDDAIHSPTSAAIK